MKIVDAQVHIWSSGTPSGHHRQVPVFSAEELLMEMDAAGVDAAVIHPPVSWDPDANQTALDAAKRYPDRFAVLGQVPLDQIWTWASTIFIGGSFQSKLSGMDTSRKDAFLPP